MSFFGRFFSPKSSAELETEKAAELAKISASYDEQIAAARAKEGAPPVGTTTAVGGRRKKTRRSKKKSRRQH